MEILSEYSKKDFYLINEIVRNNNIVTNTNSLVFDIFLTIVSSFT